MQNRNFALGPVIHVATKRFYMFAMLEDCYYYLFNTNADFSICISNSCAAYINDLPKQLFTVVCLEHYSNGRNWYICWGLFSAVE